MSRTMTIVLSAILLWIPQVLAQNGVNAPVYVALKGDNCDFAINPETGAVAAIDPSANTLTIYPRAYLDGTDTKVIGPTEVGVFPQSVVFKAYKDKAYFVVTCVQDNTLYVLDAATAQVVKKIKSNLDSVSFAVASLDSADPYVYYTGGRGHDSVAARISLAEMKDEGKQKLSDSVMEVAISADGNLLYTLGPWSPSGFEVNKRRRGDDGKDTWDQMSREHDTRGKYLPDPFSYLTAAGDRKIYTADLRKVVATIDCEPMSFFSDRPLLIGCKMPDDLPPETAATASLTAFSTITFKPFGRVSLPGLPIKDRALEDRGDNNRINNTQGDFKRFVYEFRCLPDLAGDRVLAAYDNKIAVVPLKCMNAPKEPVPLVRASVPPQVSVGQAVTIHLKPVSDGTTVELKEGPAGMKFQAKDSTVTWTPTADQIGDARFVTRTSGKDSAVEQVFDLEVSQLSIRLPFVASGLAVSPSGKLAVAYSLPMMDRIEDRSKQSRLALIDLEKLQVLAEKTLLKTITTAAVDDQAVYIAPSDSDRLETLSLKDLASDRRVNTEGAVQQFAFGTKVLAVTTDKGLAVYSLPDLKKRDLPGKPPAQGGQETPFPPKYPGQMGYVDPRMRDDGYQPETPHFQGGWLNRGLYFSDDFGTVRSLVAMPHLPFLQKPNAAPGMFGPYPSLWGRRIIQNQLMTSGGQSVARLQAGSSSLMMPDVPGVVVAWNSHNTNMTKQTIQLQVVDLVTGKAVLDQVLRERVVNRNISDPENDFFLSGQRQACVASVGRRIVVAFGKEVFVADLSDEIVKQLSGPLEIELPQEIAVFTPKAPGTLAIKVRGGEKPLEFDLKNAITGIDIDKASGVITFDTAVLSKPAYEALMGGVSQRGGYGDDPEKIQPQLEEAAREARAQFKSITGKDIAGLPVLVPVSVVATDKNQQLAQLDFQVVLEMPKESIGAIIKEAAAAVKKREEEARKVQDAYEAQAREAEKARMARLGFVATQPSGEQIEKLERRVAELEGKVDLMIKLLQEKK